MTSIDSASVSMTTTTSTTSVVATEDLSISGSLTTLGTASDRPHPLQSQTSNDAPSPSPPPPPPPQPPVSSSSPSSNENSTTTTTTTSASAMATAPSGQEQDSVAAATTTSSEGGVRAKIGKHLQNASAFAKWMINGQGGGPPSAQDVASRAFQSIVRSVMPKSIDGRQPDLGEILRSPAFVSLCTVGLSLEGQLLAVILKILLESKRRLKTQELALQQFQDQQQLKLSSSSGGDSSAAIAAAAAAAESEGKSKKRNSKKELKKQQKLLEAAAAAAAAIPLVPEITEYERSVLDAFHAKSRENGGSLFLEYQGLFSEMLDMVSQARMKLEKREKGKYSDEQFSEMYLRCVGKLEKQARQFRAAAGINFDNLFGGIHGGAASAVTDQPPVPLEDDDPDESNSSASPNAATVADAAATAAVSSSSSGSSSGGESSSGDENADPEKHSNGKHKSAEKESLSSADAFKEGVQFRIKMLSVLTPVAVRCQGLQPYTQHAMVQVLMGKLPNVALPDNANSVQYAIIEFMSRLSFTVFQLLRSCALSIQPKLLDPSRSPSEISDQPSESDPHSAVHIDEDNSCLVSPSSSSSSSSPPPPSASLSPPSSPPSADATSASGSCSTGQPTQPRSSTIQSASEADPEFLAKVQKESSIGLMVMLKKVENALSSDHSNGVNRLQLEDEQIVQLKIRQSVDDLKQQLKDGLANTVRECLQQATVPHEPAIRRIVERLVEIASGKPVTDPVDVRRLNNIFEFSRVYPDKSCLVHLLIEVFRCAFNVGKIAKTKKMDLREAEDLRIASLRRNESEGNDEVIRAVLEFVPTLYPISFACIDVSKDMHLALTKARDNDKSGIKDIAMRRRIKRNTLSNTISQCVIKLGELSAQLYVHTHNGGDFLGPDECLAKAKDSISEWVQFCEETAFAGAASKDANNNNNDPGSDSASTDNPNEDNDGNIIDIGTQASNSSRAASKDADDADTISSGKKAAKKKKNKGKGKQKKQ